MTASAYIAALPPLTGEYASLIWPLTSFRHFSVLVAGSKLMTHSTAGTPG